LRYEFQLCTKVRRRKEDPKHKNLTAAEIAQNKIFWVFDNSTLKDRRSTSNLIHKFDLLSVNQIAANIKVID
jgi:hypothetical protein